MKSVLDQDYPNFEVIAVDDSSTDNTLQVLNSIDDERLKVVVNKGVKGAAGARNAGAQCAKSEWVAFQDSDDIWLPGKLSKQMAHLADSNFVAVYCGMDCYEQNKLLTRIPNDITKTCEGDLTFALLMDSFISTQTVIIRRDIFEKINGMDTSFSALDDWEMMIRVSLEGPIGFVDETLVEQHMSPNSITNSSEKRVNAQIQMLKKHYQLWSKHPEALARHHNRISGALQRQRRFKDASDHANQAFRHRPWDLRYATKALAFTFARFVR